MNYEMNAKGWVIIIWNNTTQYARYAHLYKKFVCIKFLCLAMSRYLYFSENNMNIYCKQNFAIIRRFEKNIQITDHYAAIIGPETIYKSCDYMQPVLKTVINKTWTFICLYIRELLIEEWCM